MKNLRVRSAPSNSGSDIHLGNLRTFLFNYLVAKKNGGTFILRMEDSDQSRCKDEYADNILNTLRNIGLPPDEGYKCDSQPYPPYQQTQKMAQYKAIAEKLIADGHCYKCYCSKDELDTLRKVALEKNPKAPFKYNGKCRDLKDHPADAPYTIRFKAPVDGETILNDRIFGKIVFPHKENYDFPIMRSDGSVLFNFSNVVDDIDHKINLIIRGRDHIANHIQQALIYKALGHEMPATAYLGMVLNQQGAKLSKRDGGVSVSYYLNECGYAPGAILNYMARFGFGFGDGNKEIFDLQFMIDNFDLNRCGKSDGRFDPKKFLAINAEHLKSETLTPTPKYAVLLKPFIDAKKLGEYSSEQLEKFIPVIRSRAKTFVEAAELLAPMLAQDISPSEEMMKSTFTEDNKKYLISLTKMFLAMDTWNETLLRANVASFLTENKITLKEIGGPLRVSLLGTPNSPELFQVLNVIGKETSLARLNTMLSKF